MNEPMNRAPNGDGRKLAAWEMNGVMLDYKGGRGQGRADLERGCIAAAVPRRLPPGDGHRPTHKGPSAFSTADPRRRKLFIAFKLKRSLHNADALPADTNPCVPAMQVHSGKENAGAAHINALSNA